MDYSSLENLCDKLNITVLKNESMKKHTSFKIGGDADRFIKIDSINKALEIYSFLNINNIPYFILGNGSNILVSDSGIRSVVILLEGEFKNIELVGEDIIHCGAGAMLSSVCIFAKNNNLSGLEFAYGIPGTIGGAVYMNAGAYGGEMKDVVVKSCHVFENKLNEFDNGKLNFSYRHSVYTDENYLITDVYIKLQKSDKVVIESTMNEILNKRKDKQPLEFPSAGSTFKRPEGYFAAALIDECGLKGLSVGDAQVSTKHSGFVINKGNATAQDVLLLIDKIKEEVYKTKKVTLECEVKIIGG